MIFLLLYLLGFIVSYYLCKQLRNIESQNEWVDIKLSFIISTLSWFAVVLLLIALAMISKDKDPPKGL